MLKKLYDWTLSLAGRKTAEAWLAIIAFVESSVFLVPADVLFLPMVLARPARAFRYALVATVASTLGGVAGYALGYFAYEALAKPVLRHRVVVNFAAESDGVTLDEIVDRLIAVTPAKEDQLTNDARFQKIFAS